MLCPDVIFPLARNYTKCLWKSSLSLIFLTPEFLPCRAGMGDGITGWFGTNGQPQGSDLGQDRRFWAFALGWEVVAP